MADKFDVVIIGGGPAGSFAAFHLARRGFHVAVLEARAQVKRKVCGDYICPPGRALLTEAGFTDIIERSRPIKSMRIVTSTNQVVDCPYPNDNFGIAISRLDLDLKLIEKAQAAGVEYFFGQPVTGIVAGDQEHGILTRDQRLTCRLLIGADGRTSFVAKFFEVSLGSLSDRVALRTFIRANAVNPFQAELHLLSDDEYVGIDHLSDSETSLALVISKQKLKKSGSPLEALQAALKRSELLSRSHRWQEDPSVDSSTPLSHAVRKVVGTRWALIGDAAGYVDPITGEGNYMALLTSSELAGRLKDPSILDDSVLLRSTLEQYGRWHRQNVQLKLKINRGFQFLIRRPGLVNLVGKHLLKKESRRRAFIEIVGNVCSPMAALPRLLT